MSYYKPVVRAVVGADLVVDNPPYLGHPIAEEDVIGAGTMARSGIGGGIEVGISESDDR